MRGNSQQQRESRQLSSVEGRLLLRLLYSTAAAADADELQRGLTSAALVC